MEEISKPNRPPPRAAKPLCEIVVSGKSRVIHLTWRLTKWCRCHRRS